MTFVRISVFIDLVSLGLTSVQNNVIIIVVNSLFFYRWCCERNFLLCDIRSVAYFKIVVLLSLFVCLCVRVDAEYCF
jgi:hypothetical protein